MSRQLQGVITKLCYDTLVNGPDISIRLSFKLNILDDEFTIQLNDRRLSESQFQIYSQLRLLDTVCIRIGDISKSIILIKKVY